MVGGPAPFLFPAADPQAAFTLAEYLSAGGLLTQAEGHPAIDPAALEDVLTFYGSAYSAGVLPLTSRQYESPRQTLGLFDERRAASAVAPLEAWMDQPRSGSAAASLPTRDGAGIALARTWSWTLVTRDDDLQATAVALVEWLSDPSFLGPWTFALGSLPPNAVALEEWPAGPSKTLVQQLVNVALPRVRDFRGAPTKSFDGRGNYTMGLEDQLIFPEIDYSRVSQSRGMNITFVTTSRNDQGARRLLELLGLPFRRN